MKRSVVLATFLLIVVGCGSETKTQALAEGWTTSNVASEKQSCRTALAGDATAETYCNCVIDTASTTLAYRVFKTPSNASETAKVNELDVKCSK